MPSYEELIALAEQRAATEVVTWIPEKKGDRLAGKVVETGTITTRYGAYYTNTLETFKSYVENGEEKQGDGKLLRVAYMGAVLQATFLRTRPGPGDVVAFHYQDDVTPQSGMNDYALIACAVFDKETGMAKIPVDLSIAPVTSEDVVNADPRTGEITPGVSPLEPRADEEPFS